MDPPRRRRLARAGIFIRMKRALRVQTQACQAEREAKNAPRRAKGRAQGPSRWNR